jgi:hypothetical protein
MWMKERCRTWSDRVFRANMWQDEDWIENLRMSRATFLYICDRLRPYIQRQDRRMRRALPVEDRVALTLWKLATPGEFRTLNHLFGLGRSTICTIVHDTCQAICEVLLASYLKFPSGDRLTDVVNGYDDVWDVPQCAGCIDGMHVPIKAPTEHPADY